MPKFLTSLVPYLRRAVRVFLYTGIPVAAQYVIDSNAEVAEIGLRFAIAGSLLALLDKANAARIARKV